MKSYDETLHEAVLLSFEKVLAGYDTSTRQTALIEVGRLVRDYLQREGFNLPELDPIDDFPGLLGFFRVYGEKLQRHGEHHSLVLENQRLVELTATQADELDASLRRELEVKRELHHESERSRKQKLDLHAAGEEIKILHGLLPICSFCMKIRTDDGHWLQLERYIIDNSEATFTHGACPSCFGDYYSEYAMLDREEIVAWASPSQKIKILIDSDKDITVVRLENGYRTADSIAALDRIYQDDATAGILWDLTGVEAIDFDNVDRDARYRIDRVVNDYEGNSRRRKRTAHVCDANADRMVAAVNRTAEIFRSRAPHIEFKAFTDIDEAMAWVTGKKDRLPVGRNG